MLAIILTGLVLTSAIMLSFSPIVIFFLITSNNYDFLKLLHVAIIGFAGIFGMRTIVEALKFSCEKKNVYPKIGVKIFQFWIIILAFVGMQLAWSLRPFIGAKDRPYQLLRKQEGNFYLAVLQSTGRLLNLLDQRRPAGQELKKNSPQKEAEKKDKQTIETQDSSEKKKEDDVEKK
jgi:hypothetical protein